MGKFKHPPGNRYMMCTHHSNGKRCLYGADCKFAHSQEELDLWNATIVTRSVSVLVELLMIFCFNTVIGTINQSLLNL